MLGFSDGTKDGGYLQAIVLIINALYCTGGSTLFKLLNAVKCAEMVTADLPAQVMTILFSITTAVTCGLHHGVVSVILRVTFITAHVNMAVVLVWEQYQYSMASWAVVLGNVICSGLVSFLSSMLASGLKAGLVSGVLSGLVVLSIGPELVSLRKENRERGIVCPASYAPGGDGFQLQPTDEVCANSAPASCDFIRWGTFSITWVPVLIPVAAAVYHFISRQRMEQQDKDDRKAKENKLLVQVGRYRRTRD